MAEKQSVLGRVTALAQADVETLIDDSADPEALFIALGRAFTTTIAEAEEALAAAVATKRLTEHDRSEDRQTADDWGVHAATAAYHAAELRVEGNMSGAAIFEGLARAALERQLTTEQAVADAAGIVAALASYVDRLREQLDLAKDRLALVQERRAHQLGHVEPSDGRVLDPETADVLDPDSDLWTFEQKLLREDERQTSGVDRPSFLDERFTGSVDPSLRGEIERRLELLSPDEDELVAALAARASAEAERVADEAEAMAARAQAQHDSADLDLDEWESSDTASAPESADSHVAQPPVAGPQVAAPQVAAAEPVEAAETEAEAEAEAEPEPETQPAAEPAPAAEVPAVDVDADVDIPVAEEPADGTETSVAATRAVGDEAPTPADEAPDLNPPAEEESETPEAAHSLDAPDESGSEERADDVATAAPAVPAGEAPPEQPADDEPLAAETPAEEPVAEVPVAEEPVADEPVAEDGGTPSATADADDVRPGEHATDADADAPPSRSAFTDESPAPAGGGRRRADVPVKGPDTPPPAPPSGFAMLAGTDPITRTNPLAGIADVEAAYRLARAQEETQWDLPAFVDDPEPEPGPAGPASAPIAPLPAWSGMTFTPYAQSSSVQRDEDELPTAEYPAIRFDTFGGQASALSPLVEPAETPEPPTTSHEPRDETIDGGLADPGTDLGPHVEDGTEPDALAQRRARRSREPRTPGVPTAYEFAYDPTQGPAHPSFLDPPGDEGGDDAQVYPLRPRNDDKRPGQPR
ncbi:PspA/IM30 family protein [Mumia qirimensis]|uniref:PspA/IM30 family protein n=1 Tax=Mumia qirimensis TaxID=3234852 RepID=UPI00351D8B0F